MVLQSFLYFISTGILNFQKRCRPEFISRMVVYEKPEFVKMGNLTKLRFTFYLLLNDIKSRFWMSIKKD